MKPGGLRDVPVVEIPIFVFEGDVAIEVERAEIGEVLDLIRRVEPGGDRREQQREKEREDRELASGQEEKAAEAIEKGDDRCYLSATYFRICARLNPAWLTIGATMLPRRR